LLYQPAITKPEKDVVSLECNEVLDHFCTEQVKEDIIKIKLEEDLLCE
jgi:hypothetical protein